MKFESEVLPDEKGIIGSGILPPDKNTCYFARSRMRVRMNDLTSLFKVIVEKHKENDLIESLKIIEPKLKNLTVLPVGNIPVLHGDIDGKINPLPFLGEGLARMSEIMIGVMSVQPGFLLVDELENEFHHSILAKVWESINFVSKANNCQVFITTHSWECVLAALKVFEVDKQDLMYYRLDKDDNDNIQAHCFKYDLLKTAVESEMEVR
jgi:AAA15 family ATPase/GTPase